MGTDRKSVLLSVVDFLSPPHTVGRIEMPLPYAPNNAAFQKGIVNALMKARIQAPPPTVRGAVRAASGSNSGRGSGSDSGDDPLDPVALAAAHPVASCADARRHVKAAERAERLTRDLDRTARTVKGQTESLARQFDRVLRVMEAFGYVDGWSLTSDGLALAGLYHECDMLVAEVVRGGLLDGLDPATVAGLVSTFTFEARGPGGGPSGVWFPSAKARERWAGIERLAQELNAVEEDAGLPKTRQPDPGFVPLAYSWAAGDDLGEVLAGEEVSGGDFVRNVKTLIDLLRQVGDVAIDPATAAAARIAADRLFRGVVAASSVVGGGLGGAGVGGGGAV